MLFGFVNLSELVKYLRVKRYLAAKIGTIFWFFCGGSSLLRMDDVVLLFCWVSAVFE
jgi:hypothetical protein